MRVTVRVDAVMMADGAVVNDVLVNAVKVQL